MTLKYIVIALPEHLFVLSIIYTGNVDKIVKVYFINHVAIYKVLINIGQ